ncbi:MAG: fibrobacter succinogenes major paralogous domain-containing protein [Fibromonadaceae bacterium]|jgi:uncharacterized protein (TIGR02145 family)|nr:fibrobacter succinogenes major paralogous domain-containing protein [Fibromonadaceae bacterium]
MNKIHSNGKRFFAPAIAAGLALAMAFTLNACGGDGGSGGGGDEAPSSSSQPSHEHTWGEWSVTTAPTCEAAGVKTRACTGDNSHKDTEEIAKLDWSAWTVTAQATPTTAGLETRTCPGNASTAQTRLLYPKCGGVEYDPADGKFCDNRDNKFYKYVDIDGQIWMAENLNHNVDGSKCGSTLSGSGTLSDEDDVACDKYGRLYDWNTAMGGAPSSVANPSGVQGVCPSGWHLPSDAEWQTLIDFVGGDETAGTKLKAASVWNNNGYGNDDYGFFALPGGFDGYSGVDSFDDVGYTGYWWSTSERSYFAYYRSMHYLDESVYWDYQYKDHLYSVRCVQD